MAAPPPVGYAQPHQPRQSSGLGALGIVLIILGIFVFLGAIVGVGAFFFLLRAEASSPPTSYGSPYSTPTPVAAPTVRAPYSDIAGRYTVDFPGTPKTESSTDDTELGKVTLHEAKYEASKNLAYAVNYTDFPISGRAFNTEAALDGAVNGAGKGGSVLYSNKIKLGTVSGRDFQVKVSDPIQPFRICSRVFQDGPRQYQVLVLVSEGQYLTNKTAIDAFLTSFTID